MQGSETLVEGAGCLWYVEDVQMDARPVAIGAAHAAGDVLECAARAVQFAVQRPGRVVGEEAGGRVEGMAGAADELVTVPIGAHTVEFFAHRPAAHVLPVIFAGEDEVGGGSVGGGAEERGYGSCLRLVEVK